MPSPCPACTHSRDSLTPAAQRCWSDSQENNCSHLISQPANNMTHTIRFPAYFSPCSLILRGFSSLAVFQKAIPSSYMLHFHIKIFQPGVPSLISASAIKEQFYLKGNWAKALWDSVHAGEHQLSPVSLLLNSDFGWDGAFPFWWCLMAVTACNGPRK